ncbi:MAG: acetylglutamate kinase [Acidobacteriota bacterium]|nr:acetylglutamate kinase [Acidobacteriota bacterium]
MKTLVKIGGTLLDSPVSRDELARQIASAALSGHEPIVVHGGGKQITRFLDARGIESRFVNGMRVTTPEILDAVIAVLRQVNRELAGALREAGARAVEIFADDGSLVVAEQMDARLGAVGRIIRCHPEVLKNEAGSVPVIACIAGDGRGNRYNVNGDQMALACAVGFRVDRLIFLTDVEGVLDGGGKAIRNLSAADAIGLIDAGIAKGGMQAKLNAAVSALQQGIHDVHIVRGSAESIVQRVLQGDVAGTRMAL